MRQNNIFVTFEVLKSLLSRCSRVVNILPHTFLKRSYFMHQKNEGKKTHHEMGLQGMP